MSALGQRRSFSGDNHVRALDLAHSVSQKVLLQTIDLNRIFGGWFFIKKALLKAQFFAVFFRCPAQVMAVVRQISFAMLFSGNMLLS